MRQESGYPKFQRFQEGIILSTIDQIKLSMLAKANIKPAGNTGTALGGDFKKVMNSIKNVPENLETIFTEAAKQYDIPKQLLKAVAKVESNFNPSATSKKGAAGVMQLMPATARSLGVNDPYDARSNIMGGAKYLKQNLQKYDGNIELTLAAYNAGGNNVKKYGGIPPFKETQQYVKKVMSYMEDSHMAGEASLYTPKNSGLSNTNSSQYTKGITQLLQAFSPNASLPESNEANSLLADKNNYLYLIELMKMRMQMSSHSISDQAEDPFGGSMI